MKKEKGMPVIFIILIALSCHVLMPMPLVAANHAETQKTEPLPANESPEAVDAYLAGMSDEQVRQVLAQNLKAASAGQTGGSKTSGQEATEGGVGVLFLRAAQGTSAVFNRIGSIFMTSEDSRLWDDAMTKITGGKGGLHLILTLFGTFAIIGFGLALRWLFRRSTTEIEKSILNAVRLGKLQFFGRVLSRMLLEVLGIGIFAAATFALFVIFYQQGKPDYIIVSPFLIASYYILVIAFVAKTILTPKAPRLRLFPMADRDASFLYNWFVLITVLAGLVAAISDIFYQFGIRREMVMLIRSSAGLVVVLALLIMIWQSRHRVAEALRPADIEGPVDTHSFSAALARNWMIFAALYVMVMGFVWIANVLLTGDTTILDLIISLFLVPAFIGLDQWVQRLLKVASGELPEIVDLSGDERPDPQESEAVENRMEIKHYVPMIKRFFRIILFAFLIFFSLRLWGLDLAIGRMFTRRALSIVIVVLLAFIVWQVIKSRIDRKLKEEMPDDDEEMEEGGAGGSRIGTLLVLLRKFIMTVMFILVSLIVLSSLGIDIGPLIAGAGVFGLAIGFGAQTLVKDIISGIFFLLDDAFRLGDYVEAGGAKGMVEHISLRSLKLRHPRGMVYTIPYGGMGTMTNFSRDYIVTKLTFRVRYDTNVKKVKKIIKKINKKVMAHPEMSSVMLAPIKSQGVRELDDSAMVMRVKFKTIPGEQFVVRREVFRMMQEMFREAGIEFAHRNVTVYLPPETTATSSAQNQEAGADGQIDNKLTQAAAAAAIAAEQSQEAKKEPKK